MDPHTEAITPAALNEEPGIGPGSLLVNLPVLSGRTY